MASGAPEATTRFGYDLLGRLLEVVDSSGGSTRYTYDAVGNVTAVALPNGATAAATYDARNRLTALTHRTNGSMLAAFNYTLDARGNRTAVTQADGSRVEYGYDAASRLTTERYLDGTGSLTSDAAYTYDPVGNLLVRSGSLGSASYAYNADDQLTTADGVTYAYDGAGNIATVTSGAAVTRYTYDARGRLIRSQPATGGATDYTYDSSGVRQSKSGPQGTIRYLVDRFDRGGVAQVVRESDAAGASLRTYTRGLGLIARTEAGATAYYHSDGLGSTRLVTDGSSAVVERYDYTAYGAPLGAAPTATNSHQFAGEQRDAETGLYYLRARYYDPALGRFLSCDPAPGDEREPLSLHRYQYASDNPTNRVDPTGRFDFDFGGLFGTAEVNPGGFFNLGHPFGDDPIADKATGFPRLVVHLKAARAIASTAIDLALVRLEGIDDYETYFGAFTTARGKRVKAVLDGVANLVRNPKLVFGLDLTHTGSEDAYTQVDGKFRVWFTAKFTHWYTTDTSGVNTAALIAHELSHEVSDQTGPGTGTDDVVDSRCTGDVRGRCYGKANATYLAKNHPDQAVNNADNYGLYVVAPYTR